MMVVLSMVSVSGCDGGRVDGNGAGGGGGSGKGCGRGDGAGGGLRNYPGAR